MQGFYGKLFALADAHAAADTPRGVELGFSHAHDAEVMHTHFITIVGTSRKSDLDVKIVRENSLFDAFCQCRRIVVAKGADAVADAGHDVPRTGRFKTSAPFTLIDVEFINDRLQCFLDFFHLVKGNPQDFKALTDGQMDVAIAIRFCNILNLAQYFGIQGATGDTYTGRSHIAMLRYPESVFL
jgi:hypothetical protein